MVNLIIMDGIKVYAYVDFEMEDGEIEQKHVSVNWLEFAEENMKQR